MKKTLASILSALALATPNVKAQTNETGRTNNIVIDVPVYTSGVNIQGAIDSAIDGDTIRLVRGNTYIARFGDIVVDKDLTFTTTYNEAIWINSSTPSLMTVTSNAHVQIRGIHIYGYTGYDQTAFNVIWAGSLTLDDVLMANYRRPVNFDSTGNLLVTGSNFQSSDDDSPSINIARAAGKITVDRTLFFDTTNPIYVNPNPLSATGTVNIVNNTFYEQLTASITLSQSTTNLHGYISNNAFVDQKSNAVEGLSSLLASSIYYSNNNDGKNTGKTNVPAGVQSVQGVGTNFYFDTAFAGGFHLTPDSPLWNRGLYVHGLTTWFPNEQQTWIGYSGQGMPMAVPEPSTGVLLGGGLAALLAANNKRKRENDVRSQQR